MSDRGVDASAIVDDAAHHRFELVVDGETAFLDYRRNPKRLLLVHTEVPDALGGRGIGGELVRAAVASAAANGLIVVPKCPFARDYLEKHPDVAAQVEIAWPTGATG
jgi:uncharacterized protein